MTTTESIEEAREQAWRGFQRGPWTSRINVRDFIRRNYTSYEGDASFLVGPTEAAMRFNGVHG